ncbi:ATP-binding protein [Planctomycetota bacterium]
MLHINNMTVNIPVMYKERHITNRLEGLLSYFPAVVLVGARQTGKSTLLEHILGQRAEFVVFDPLDDVENARAEPELFLDNHKTPLVLDEIQYAPELVPVLKRRIDHDRSPGQYIITGSQQWAVMKSLSESLAGRAVFLDLHGFSLQEIAESRAPSWLAQWLETPNSEFLNRVEHIPTDDRLYERIWRGCLPEATLMPLQFVQDFHKGYLQTYIERDARQFSDVSDWQLFSRFFRLTAACTAQEVNFSHLGRELGLNPQTARRWLDILKATFQWIEIPPYFGNTIKRICKSPKGYVADTGLACHAQAVSTPNAVAAHPLWGSLFETAVVNEIQKHLSLMSPAPNLYHWRTHRGAEVDILLERDGTYYPLEIKASSQVSRKHTSGIQAFRKTYENIHTAPGLVVAPLEKPLPLSETDFAVPWDIQLR